MKIKILYLEDSPEEVLSVSDILTKRKFFHEVLAVKTRDEFVKALYDFLPDIIVSEYSLPDFSSAEALAILRESRIKIPFILFSDGLSDEKADELLTTGADDYIAKDQPGRLSGAIHRNLEKYRLGKENQNLQGINKK